ncbi:intraflagellar transport complex B protein 46 C terminal-domain-containing protein, partial [Chytriomyces sp. MP71]
MPGIEDLMQVWPVEIEEALSIMILQNAELEIPLASYARLLTALLDIPTPSFEQKDKENNPSQSQGGAKRKPSTSTIESLHVLFTLYSEFKNSQHFRVSEGRWGVEKVSGRVGHNELEICNYSCLHDYFLI